MTPRIILAILLIVVGVLGLGYGRFSFTEKKKVVDLGSVEITRNEHKSIAVPPVVGSVLIVAGVLLLVTGRRAHA